MDAGREPPEGGSEPATQQLSAVADQTIEMPRSAMPDRRFLQDALVVPDPGRQRGDEDRTWKIAVGVVVLIGLGVVIVVLGSYFIRVGPLFGGAEAKPALPEAAGSTREAARPALGDGITPTPASAQPVGTGPSPTATGALTTSPPRAPTSTPAGSPLRTFSSVGGTIVAGCSGSNAYLASWQAAADYRVKWVAQGPASGAAVNFKAQSAEFTMTVTCPSGVPVVSTSSKVS